MRLPRTLKVDQDKQIYEPNTNTLQTADNLHHMVHVAHDFHI